MIASVDEVSTNKNILKGWLIGIDSIVHLFLLIYLILRNATHACDLTFIFLYCRIIFHLKYSLSQVNSLHATQ